MCIKFPPKYLNPDFFPLHSTSTYTCRVIIVLMVHNGKAMVIFFFFFFAIIVRSTWEFRGGNVQVTGLAAYYNYLYKKIKIKIVTSVLKAHNINEHKPQYTKRCCHIKTLYKTLSSISHTR